jgi:hypothetical protein
MKITKLFIVMLCITGAMLAITSCQKPIPLPPAFIGTWQGDADMLRNNPQIRALSNEKKGDQSLELLIKVFESMKVIVTDTTFTIDMTVNIPGQEKSKKSFTYRVEKATPGEAYIVNKDEGSTGGRYRLVAVDADHIKMVNIINESQPKETLLKRAQ